MKFENLESAKAICKCIDAIEMEITFWNNVYTLDNFDLGGKDGDSMLTNGAREIIIDAANRDLQGSRKSLLRELDKL